MRLIRVFFVLVFLSLTSLHAQFIVEGDYSFDVEVVNSEHKPVWFAKVRVVMAGFTALIRANAKGYFSSGEAVLLRANQKHYQVKIQLKDPVLNLEVRDTKGKRVPAQVEKSQFGAEADRFQFKLLIPGVDYSGFREDDVEIELNQKLLRNVDIRVNQGGFAKNVIVRILRKDLRDYANSILVRLPRNEDLNSVRRTLKHKRLFERQNRGEIQDLTIRWD